MKNHSQHSQPNYIDNSSHFEVDILMRIFKSNLQRGRHQVRQVYAE